MKKNCWDFKQCGRQPGGHRTQELGICPAAIETRLDGIHGGSRAGRACWIVAGTYCKGEVQGTYAKKFKNCQQCEFYAAVREEEYPNFQLSATLIVKLESRSPE